MEDVLDVYQRLYDPNYPVICIDEKSKQLIGDLREPIAMKPGKPRRYDTSYRRGGTCNVFMCFEPFKPARYIKVTQRRTKQDWAYLIKHVVDELYPHAKKVVLVQDNLNIHRISSLYSTFDPATAKRLADKLEVHYTPVHGSWLNMAEIELSHLGRQCLNRRMVDIEVVRQEVVAWQEERNRNSVIVHWRFTTADARIKLKKLYPVIASSRHN